MVEYIRYNMLCMCKRSHSHGGNEYVYGSMYRVSEFFFSRYYYYEVSDMVGNFMGNISETFFEKDFEILDDYYLEVDKMFNNIIDGDVVII